MLEIGSTILLPTPDVETAHLWIIITDPNKGNGNAVIVNVTSKRKGCDTSVVLNVGDHPFIKHPSIIRYSDARNPKVSALENAVNSGRFSTHRVFTEPVLSRIQKGIFISEFTPRKIKAFCKLIL